MTNLVLIPTQGERQTIESNVKFDSQKWSVHTIGFGVIAAGIETMRLLNRLCPDQVVLAGIAGLFQPDATDAISIGQAIWANRVFVDDIGVGQGDAFIDAKTLGWSVGKSPMSHNDDDSENLVCQTPVWTDGVPILTVCNGSATTQDATRRMARFPKVVAEEMEGYAVALACHKSNTRLSIVRGCSNIVGDRDKSRWQIRQALQSVSEQLQRYMDQSPQ